MDEGLSVDIQLKRPEFSLSARLDVPRDSGITALFGASGSGKTTLLRCIAGLELPQAGHIRFAREPLFDRGVNVPPHRRRFGFVTQEDCLFPHLTVRRNLEYALPKGSESSQRIEEVAAQLGIPEWTGRRPGQISGGQRQRVALARALVGRPRLLLLDEPLTALDVPARESVRLELRRLLASLGIPAIVVTHDRNDVLALADRVAVIAAGSIRQIGTVTEVFGSPADAEVARLVGIDTVCNGRIVSADRGIARVRIGDTEILAVCESSGGEVLVCIRGEDVVLHRRAPGGDSVRNRLSGRVAWIRSEGALVRVGIDCGFPLAATITRPAAEELELRPGSEVGAAIKATAVHLIPR